MSGSECLTTRSARARWLQAVRGRRSSVPTTSERKMFDYSRQDLSVPTTFECPLPLNLHW